MAPLAGVDLRCGGTIAIVPGVFGGSGAGKGKPLPKEGKTGTDDCRSFFRGFPRPIVSIIISMRPGASSAGGTELLGGFLRSDAGAVEGIL